jgi:ubiquinone/menaquinone biosynthesis C-methylase UbiE
MVSTIDAARLSEILLPDVDLRLVEPHLYSPYAPGEQTNSYDDKGALSFYDQVACNRMYNRLVWGYDIGDYHSLCRQALNSSTEGWVLDAGCGALAFTAKTYAGYDQRPVIFLDQSITLLRLAKQRIVQLTGAVPDNVVFLHGDVRELPFKPKSFGTIICLNLLHVLEDVAGVLRTLRKILLDEGTIAFTTLIETNRLADRYLRMWAKAGELVPRTATQLLAIFEGLGMPITYRIRGNMAFIAYV